MTSVPNLRQPLSGNKYLLFFILFLSSFVVNAQTKLGTDPVRRDNQTGPLKQDGPVDWKHIEDGQFIRRGNNLPIEPNTPNPAIQEKPKRELTPDAPIIKIGLFLGLEQETSAEKLSKTMGDNDPAAAKRNALEEHVVESLHFYQGWNKALNQLNSNIKYDITLYDTYNSDSVLQELLDKKELSSMDYLIGPVTNSNAKLVADYCKRTHTYNLQPFSAAKNGIDDNPFHVKLVPTIETHLQQLFTSIVDSFSKENVIMFYPKKEKDSVLAYKMNALFTAYNDSHKDIIRTAILNSTDFMVDGAKTSLPELISSTKKTIFILTSYDESFIQSNIKALWNYRNKGELIVYGMPTWMNSEVLRLDYLNDLNLHYSDAFYLDSTRKEVLDFMATCRTENQIEPDRWSFMGYDFLNWLDLNIDRNGKSFMEQPLSFTYEGLGYDFRIIKTAKHESRIDYYENKSTHVFRIKDYRIEKVK